MANLLLKEETSDKLVFATNPESRKGFLFWKDNSETTVVLDLTYQKITQSKNTPKQPTEQTSLSLDQIKNITLYSVDYSPMPEDQWPSAMTFVLQNDSTFVFNSGRRDEMKLLTDKISKLIEKSVEEKFVSTPKDLPR